MKLTLTRDHRGRLMARKATGTVVERAGAKGRTFALRFRAYGDAST